MRPPPPLALALPLVACAAAPAPALAPTAVAAAPLAAPAVASAPEDAGATPPPALPRPNSTIVHEAAWPRAGLERARVAVVSSTGAEREPFQYLAWTSGDPARPWVDLGELRNGESPTGVAVFDATGDGEPDAVVWIDPARLDRQEIPHGAVVFSLTASSARGEPQRADWTSLALGPVRDEAGVRAALPSLRRFVLPEAARSLDDVLLRLPFATLDEFRTLVGAAGLTVCHIASGNARPHYRRCRRLAPAAITATVYADEIAPMVRVVSAPERPDDGLVGDLQRCNPTPRGAGCGVPTGGPAAISLGFTGPRPALRLTSLDDEVFEDS